MEASGLTERYAPAVRARLLAHARLIEVEELRKAAAHLLGRGKLYRPLLVLATYQAVTNAPADQHTGVACAVEILHTATLVHDDLPCLDDADLRRGVDTVHRAYGEATAILAGDALLNLAYAVVLAESAHLDGDQALAVIESLSTATKDIMEGQVLDLLGEHRELSRAELMELHRKKTGALIGACCEIGGILAGCPRDTVASLREIGVGIGLGFQIRDDLLSLQSTEGEAGKTLSTDLEKDKATFPRLLGAEAAGQYAHEVLNETQQQIIELQLPAPHSLLALARQAIARGR